MTRHHDTASRISTATLLLTGACWVEQEVVSDAIWSDDDRMLAITVTRFEVHPRDVNDQTGDNPSRGYSRQVYVLPADLSEEPQPLTERRSGGPEIYLMSEAGYLLVTWANEGHEETFQYFLDGDTRKVIDEDDLSILTEEDDSRVYHAVPSPNGDRIAVHLTEGDASSILLLDASSREQVFADEQLPFGRIIWNPQNELVFFSNEVEGSLRLQPDSLTWDTIPDPTCTWPPTSSGPVAEDGRIVSPGQSLSDPVEFDTGVGVSDGGPHNKPFGCP